MSSHGIGQRDQSYCLTFLPLFGICHFFYFSNKLSYIKCNGIGHIGHNSFIGNSNTFSLPLSTLIVNCILSINFIFINSSNLGSIPTNSLHDYGECRRPHLGYNPMLFLLRIPLKEGMKNAPSKLSHPQSSPCLIIINIIIYHCHG